MKKLLMATLLSLYLGGAHSEPLTFESAYVQDKNQAVESANRIMYTMVHDILEDKWGKLTREDYKRLYIEHFNELVKYMIFDVKSDGKGSWKASIKIDLDSDVDIREMLARMRVRYIPETIQWFGHYKSRFQ